MHLHNTDILNKPFIMPRNVCERLPQVYEGKCYSKRVKLLQFPLPNGESIIIIMYFVTIVILL